MGRLKVEQNTQTLPQGHKHGKREVLNKNGDIVLQILDV